LGFGVDAHSMLHSLNGECDAVRFSTPDVLEKFVAAVAPQRSPVSRQAAIEETFFLGLRLNRGVDLAQVVSKFGEEPVANFRDTITELVQDGLLEQEGNYLCLTSRGRMLSNEVFQRFILAEETAR